MSGSLVGQAVFIVSVGLILYVYFGYPLLMFVMARLAPKNVEKAPIRPSVSFIIAAYNEALDIRQKLENTLRLEYPEEKLEIIVTSDASTDGTDDIAREFAGRGVRLVRQPERRGKTAAQNLAVEAAAGEIIVFSDATSMYEPDAVCMLAANFADASVGCVAGKLVYVDPAATTVGSGVRSYWNYESFLKRNESTASSLIGVSGCIYAVRRANYLPMYPEACSDFLIATVIRKQGLRTVYEPLAVCAEVTNGEASKEMKMRVRVISQTFTDLWRNREMLDPFHSGIYALQLLSHKVLRYSIPIFLAAAFVSSAVLAFNSRVFLLIFAVQAAFFAAAVAAWVLERIGVKGGPLSIPLYFLLANIASVAGFIQFLKGERYAAWEPIRDSGQR